MDIYKVFEDPRIKMLENDIALWNDHCRYTDEEKHVMKQLLRCRSNVLYELNVYDSDMHQLLVSFNDRLRKACAELYNKVMTTYEEYCNRTDSFGDFEVEGKIYLGAEYPNHHPLQTETAKQVWDALTQGGFEPLYDDGCAWSLHCSKEYPPEHGGCETFEKWIGMEDENDNWNEELDREWSKDLHMIQPFHNLYDHCNFSLYDLIYVHDFDLEVHIQLERNVKYE